MTPTATTAPTTMPTIDPLSRSVVAPDGGADAQRHVENRLGIGVPATQGWLAVASFGDGTRTRPAFT